MAAPITNEPYSEQVSRAFDALKFATPQQLAMTAQAIQGNPQSPEALALASANNFQQQQRSAAAQMPQQTVYQQQIGKLLASLQPPPQSAPMQGGIASVGANQFAMQDAAMQDPMRNAGIGAAPENEPQQAATGGLVALAQGGPVRGFSGLDGSYADLQNEDVSSHPAMWSQYSPRKAHPSVGRSIDIALEKPDVRDEKYPVTSMFDTMTEEQPEAVSGGSTFQRAVHPLDKAFETVTGIKAPDLGASILSPATWRSEAGINTGLSPSWRAASNPLISDDASPQNTTPAAQQTPAGTAPKTPPSAAQPKTPDQRPRGMATPQTPQTPQTPATPAKQEPKKPELTAEQQIAELEKLLNVDTPMAAELKGQMEKRHAESKKENTLMALAQGIGSMMAAQTPHAGQAFGAGLLAAAGAYQGGEDRLDKQQAAIDALQLRPELMRQANRQTAFTAMMDQEKAKIAALAKFREDRAKFGESVALKNLEGTQQENLKRMDIGADKAKLMMQARQARELETLKYELQQHGVKPEQASGAYMKAYQTLVENGMDPNDPATAQMAADQARTSFNINTSAPGATPAPQPQRVAGTRSLYTPPR